MAQLKPLPQKMWTFEEIQTIIHCVRKREYLFDRKHSSYKDNQKKEKAWDEIAAILKTKTPRECKRKWNTLRIQQRRIVIRQKNNSTKAQHIQWHCFDLLQFLIPHMEWNFSSTKCTDYSECDEEIEETMEYETYNKKEDELPDEEQHEVLEAEEVEQPAHHLQSIIYLQDQKPTAITESNEVDYLTENDILTNDQQLQSQPQQLHQQQANLSTADQCNDKFILRQEHNNSTSLNYFLMDVQLQMEKLNEICQMELKIDIQKLLLEKLRYSDNLK